MKIAIIHDNLEKFGGAENIIVNYISKLTERGYDITLVTGGFKKDYWTSSIVENIKVSISRNINFNKNPFKYELLGFGAARDLKAYDEVIVHNWLNASVLQSFAKKKNKQPWVWFCEEPPRYIHYNKIDKELYDYWYKRRYHEPNLGINAILNYSTREFLKILRMIDKNYVKRAYKMIAGNSHYTANNIKEVYGLQARTVHLGIDTELAPLNVENKKDELGCNFLLLHVGRLTPAKNLPRLLKAISFLDKSFDFKLVIVGTGESEAHLKRLANRLGIDKNVAFLGHVGHKELADYFNSADVIPFLPINEPFGLVPVEAMACGKVVIASATGGPSEVVIDKSTGFLCDPFNVKALTEKIHSIMEQPTILVKMGRNAKQRYNDYFTLDKGVTRFEQSLIAPFEDEL